MEQREDTRCEVYLKSKSKYPDEDIHILVSKILKADPDPNGSNCQWLVDAYLNEEFRLDEDEPIVKQNIIKFKILYGTSRPLAPKGYRQLKEMIREKEEKEANKSSKSKVVTKVKKVKFTDCKSFFKNVKNNLPQPYITYSKEETNQLFEEIQKANPTDDFNNCIWIVEELIKENIQIEDLPQVKMYIVKYIKKLPLLPLPNFYPNFPIYSNYQLVKDAVNNVVELISTSDLGILLIPLTEEASCYYGAQTSWCTAQRNEYNKFEDYAENGNLYIWFDKQLKDKFQFQFETNQFMDRDDNRISTKQINEFRKHPVLKLIFKDYEDLIIDPEDAYLYAKDILKGRWEEREKIIKKDARYSYLYAREVLKRRWEEGEEIFLTNLNYAYLYALNVLKGRWPQNEEIGKQIEEKIKNDCVISYKYAHSVLQRPWPEAEANILKNNYCAYQYAQLVLQERWPEAEQKIIKDQDAVHAYQYAMYVIKNRWPEAEDVIMKNPMWASGYAKFILKKRWPEAEPYINQSLTDWKSYKNFFNI
jgi:hypothetical protein